MSSSRPLLAASYIGIEKRGEKLDAVRKELNLVINALPTQVHPTERSLYLDAILEDLSDRDEAPWTVWPLDVYILALTAIKSLGRNPVGSETLLSTDNFPILLHHSGLPSPSTFSPSRPPPSPFSAPARETLKILANLLVLHEGGRNSFASSGGAKAIARALAGKDVNGDEVSYEREEDNLERLFLLGRLGFLVTIERPRAVGVMVDTEDVVDSLTAHFTNLHSIPANHMALSELLKMTNNIIRFYPYANSNTPSSTAESEQWSGTFDPLLYPILCQFYNIPFIDLSPPLSHAIHVLLSIPFLTRLLPTWHSVPTAPSSPSISNASPTSSVKNLLNKLSNMSTGQNHNKKSSSSSSSAGESLIPPNHRKTPSPSSSRRSSGSTTTNRPTIPSPSTQDPSALPTRLLRIFDHFFESYVPWPKKIDDTLPQGLVPDEMLPPLLLLLTRAAAESEPIRQFLKETLLPSTLDRSSQAGPLEGRKGTLGDLLRLMGCAGHIQCRNTAGELMWAICKGDAADLCVEIGYGNAAGILFQKGLSGPPPAKIEEIPEPNTSDIPLKSSTSIHIQPATPTVPTHYSAPSTSKTAGPSTKSERNPITSLSNHEDSRDLEQITEEEKEREAERLFVLFDRLEKNPVISMNKSEEQGGGKVSMMDMMRDKLNSGGFEDDDESVEERRKREEQDKRDEEEANREIEEYKRRLGRK
ncbi:hypothetical protein I302_107063 [Kwoniella bestiolae CBS 10118]|uniref:Uncharacterized protein n=1 Tax=Kwoniella bestiolae CBS 10118 TaxID=1296100 RepID=A0A1B9FZM2_9TREE|nr:hypothetical protein I302_05672 [Kwoniella bestiolae CBS 10118]OCF24213.1 hypothetical protein I302_05672 [Kwoniella bestiolae CBS 10118]